MPEPLLGQFSSFTLFILGGMALGFAFDLLRGFRTILRPRGLASFLLDLSYWLAAFAIVLPLLVLGTWGELRLFAWLGLGLGVCYYRFLLHGPGLGLARGIAARFAALLEAAGGMRAARPPRKALPGTGRRRGPRKTPPLPKR